ncbi:MAG: galactose oxidase [Segetibacter sp.]|nr:galactose oxidase [Segetibacter sp.]
MKVIGINIAMKYKKFLFRFLLIHFLIISCLKNSSAQSYGLIFSSHEVVPEQRTSLDLTGTNPICFKNSFDFSFELSFVPNYSIYFGYIFRLINEKNQNIDLIYDQQKANFRLINEEAFTDINFEIDANTLTNSWTKFNFTIDENGITCTIKNNRWQSKNVRLKSNCLKIFFGASNEHNFISRDLPPMRLRNITISTDGTKKFFWPLNESTGLIAEDSISHRSANVINPVWLKPKHSNWEIQKAFNVKGFPSIAFNTKTEEVYIVSADTFYAIRANESKLNAIPLSEPHSNLLRGNQSIFNEHNNKVYNFYTDQKAVAEYDFNTNKWNRNFDNAPSTEFWHVNKFFSNNNELYILCGYGQLKYKNIIQKYNLNTKKWEIVHPSGDFLMPRYLSALGATSSGDTAYILGGFGSKEGDQLLSPKHSYDMLRYDVKSNTLKKLYTLKEPEEQFVCSNSLILTEDNKNYYTLIFPNDRFNSNLQLIKGSLTSPSFELVGKPLSYSFNDVKSFADLFYCKKSNLLLAATFYALNDNTTQVKIFSINFPPNEIGASDNAEKGITKSSSLKLLYTILPACLLIIFIMYFIKRKYRVKKQDLSIPHVIDEPAVGNPILPEMSLEAIVESSGKNDAFIPTKQEAVSETDKFTDAIKADEIAPFNEDFPGIQRSRITLFGNFEVITAEGNNITKQFTPLLKEMFLLILIYSLNYKKGVTAEKLNEILWNNKDIKDATNNRSVNLVKLKNILDKLGGCSISRETGSWKIELNPALVHLDLIDYLEIFNDKPALNLLIKADKLLQVVKAGGFLQETNYEWLDPVKSEISHFVIDILLRYSEAVNINKEPEKILSICNAIFSFDELNEHALKLKCKSLITLGRHTLAKNTFTKFSVKYREIYGEDFGQTYNSIISL